MITHRPLSALLSQVLIAYTVDFDDVLAKTLDPAGKRTAPSLAMWANVLRLIGERGVATTELPALSGIAKPAIKSMLQCLQRHGWIDVDAGGVVRFTQAGAATQRAYNEAHAAVQRRWEAVLGADALEALQSSVNEAAARLGAGYPEYPMPAPHRGAHPTGK